MAIIRKIDNSKIPIRVATTEQINLIGLQIIDGISLLEGDRVLVKNQTDATMNGVYVCKNSSWERAQDYDTSSELFSGSILYISDGQTLNGTLWMLIVEDDSDILIGNTNFYYKKIASDIKISDIPQNESFRMVSDSQIETWNKSIYTISSIEPQNPKKNSIWIDLED